MLAQSRDGTRFRKLGPLPASAEADQALALLRQLDPALPVGIGGKEHRRPAREFSWCLGMENDCAHQGCHGLKIQVADEFIGLGKIRHGHPSCSRVAEAGGSGYCLWTAVQAPRPMTAPVSRGGMRPAKAWFNGQALADGAIAVNLTEGANPLLLRYDGIARGWFVVGIPDAAEPGVTPFSPAARWIWWPGETQGVAKRFFRRDFIRLETR